MEERRRTPRIKEVNDVAITVISDQNRFPEEKIIHSVTKNISAGGVKLQTNIHLPVDTLIELDFMSKGLQQRINAIGKVKWANVIIKDKLYEAGVEFTSGKPADAIKKLEQYIAWKIQSNKSEFIKKKISPIDAADKKIPDIIEPPQIEKTQWSNVLLLLLCTMILIVIIQTLFKADPESYKDVKNVDRGVITTSKTRPTPPVAAPASVETKSPGKKAHKIKVIGNSDSKRYHLPGMKYYSDIEASHRVEFDSEADAIKAGYRKARQ